MGRHAAAGHVRSEPSDWDHWRAAGVDGVDDLGAVDALEVDRGDAEVGVPELALDYQQRDAFAGHLDRVRVSQWCGAKRRRTPAVAAVAPSCARAALADHARPQVGPLRMQNSGPTGSSTRSLQPRLDVLPGPIVHSNLTTAPALTAAHEHRATPPVEVGFAQRERFVDAQPARQSTTISPQQPPAVITVAGLAHDSDDLGDRRRVSRIAAALVTRRTARVEAGMVAGDARRPAASSSTFGMTRSLRMGSTSVSSAIDPNSRQPQRMEGGSTAKRRRRC
jgi:hypothetical protein